MLYEEADEALVSAQWRTVDAERRLLCAVISHIFQAEPLWHGEVHLVRSQSKFAAYG